MKYSIILTAALMALAVSACDKKTTVINPPAAVNTPVPGPAGPAGAPGLAGPSGSTGYTGSTGATGATGATGDSGATGERGKTGGDTVVVVPAPPPAR